MRDDLMGLSLEHALEVLKGEEISPQITQTDAPKRRGESGGMLRVVYASDDGRQLTVARFVDPIAEKAEQ